MKSTRPYFHFNSDEPPSASEQHPEIALVSGEGSTVSTTSGAKTTHHIHHIEVHLRAPSNQSWPPSSNSSALHSIFKRGTRRRITHNSNNTWIEHFLIKGHKTWSCTSHRVTSDCMAVFAWMRLQRLVDAKHANASDEHLKTYPSRFPPYLWTVHFFLFCKHALFWAEAERA